MEDSITWPVRKIISILPGDYRSTISSYIDKQKLNYISLHIVYFISHQLPRVEASWKFGGEAYRS